MLFLQQVDDFAIALMNSTLANTIIESINKNLRIQVKNLGIIDRFNGIDIVQTQHYVKLSCEKYLRKMLKMHHWHGENSTSNLPLPMAADSTSITALEDTVPPNTEMEQRQLKD